MAAALKIRGLAKRRAHFAPLDFAVDNGAVEAAAALLNSGADIEGPTPVGMTPIHLAINR